MKRVIFLLGFLLCVFPLISSILERQQQKDAVATYREEVNHSQESELESYLKEAENYNSMLYQAGGAIVGNLQEGILSEESYRKQLSMTENGIMGNIEIPKIQVNLPIYHGTEEKVLAAGVGHLPESSLPVGGENTHSVLTGHRGLPSSKLFTRLDEMEKNDLFFIRVCNEILAYRVNQIEVIEPEDMQSLAIKPEKDLVSLVTCTPYGLNTHRLVVTGERIDYKEREYISCKAQMMSWRELLFSALPFVFILIVIIKYRKDRRNAR